VTRAPAASSPRGATQTRPDLEHLVARLDPRRLHDPAHRVAVDDEVLAELLRRLQVERRGEVADLGGPSRPLAGRHQTSASLVLVEGPGGAATGSSSQCP